jgi:hypothetical protein
MQEMENGINHQSCEASNRNSRSPWSFVCPVEDNAYDGRDTGQGDGKLIARRPLVNGHDSSMRRFRRRARGQS